ncbi:MAG: PadR family transcriptional regulator [Bacillota bacterium]|nr:PadR family transcriptional regulator [Bacillota bacterium]
MGKETKKRINEPSLYILLSLLQNHLSGYAIVREVMKITKGRLEIKTGIMYPTLKILLNQGYISRVEVEKVERNKKIYKLTEKGREAIDIEMKRLETITSEIKEVITDCGDKH